MDMSRADAPVFVTGVGVVSPLGVGIEQFSQGFFHRDPLQDDGTKTRTAREVPEFEISCKFDLDDLKLHAGSKYALGAATLALEHRAVQCSPVEPSLFGLVTATSFCNGNSHGNGASGSRLISEHLSINGYRHNLSGDCLCGARAVQQGWDAVSSRQCDMLLAGGFDVPRDSLPRSFSDGIAHHPGEGAAFLSLESEAAVEEAAANPICRMASAVCLDVAQNSSGSSDEIRSCLCRAVETALERAGLWEGDIGAVFLCSGRDTSQKAREAEACLLEEVSRVPLSSVKECVGETFAASFPLECAAATLVLKRGSLPGGVALQEVSQGIEIWVEQEPQRLLGEAVLVIGCSDTTAAAALFTAD